MSLSLLAGFGPQPAARKKSRQVVFSQGAQVASHVISVMRLLQLGLDVQARIIARSCIESADLLLLCQVDGEVAKAFVECGSAEEANAFWHKHCSKNRAEKAVSNYMAAHFPGLASSRAEFLAWRSHESKAMGWAVHPSHMSGAASLFEWEPNLEEVADAGLERRWSMMSARTLDYLLSSLGSALGDLNLIATVEAGGLREMLALPKKALDDDIKRYFEVGQTHLIPVQYLTGPELLDDENLIARLKGRLPLMKHKP